VFIVFKRFVKSRKSVKGKDAEGKKPIARSSEKGNVRQQASDAGKRAEVEGRTVLGCKLVMCEDPITKEYKIFPVECPPGYLEKAKSGMREKGVKFSSDPLPDDVDVVVPEE